MDNPDLFTKKNKWPFLNIGGREDWIPPMYLQEEMKKLIKSSKLIKVEGASHNAHTDQYELVNELIDDFLKKI